MFVTTDPMLNLIEQTLQEGLADNMVTLSTEQQSSGLFSTMVIVTANSRRHLNALKNRVAKALKQSPDSFSCSIEDSLGSGWVLLDCGDVIVHLMLKDERSHYQLENLWGF